MPTGDGTCDHLQKYLDKYRWPGEKFEAAGMIRLTDGIFTLGRHIQSDIFFDFPTVSKNHAELKVDGDKLEVMDLQSRLGTIIDDSKIKALV